MTEPDQHQRSAASTRSSEYRTTILVLAAVLGIGYWLWSESTANERHDRLRRERQETIDKCIQQTRNPEFCWSKYG